ncbi:MAG: TIGR02444 family protein [Parahaliea sp.]
MDNPFWQFSLDTYTRPGVAELCLAAQDRHGLDVNLLLFAVWLGRRGLALSQAQVAALLAETAVLRTSVIAPLRALRRQWKLLAEAAALRPSLQALELAAERQLQDYLWQWASRRQPGAVASPVDNLLQVCRQGGLAGAESQRLANTLAKTLS